MANVSDWKGFEKMVATSLGGKRRFRTMESFGKTASDVCFSKQFKRKNPVVKNIEIECKKRGNLNVHALFAEAVMKYGEEGKKHIILASKVTRGKYGRALEKQGLQIEKRYRVNGPLHNRLIRKFNKRVALVKLAKKRKYALKLAKEHLKHKHSILPLVTVELSFFEDLWNAYLHLYQNKTDA